MPPIVNFFHEVVIFPAISAVGKESSRLPAASRPQAIIFIVQPDAAAVRLLTYIDTVRGSLGMKLPTALNGLLKFIISLTSATTPVYCKR